MVIENLNDVPHFGFGMMRLPLHDPDDVTCIDIEQVCRMADVFLEHGFTYFDTAYPYHKGYSERAVKEVLVNRYDRESFLLADKLPAWSLHTEEDIERIFNEQLERTGAGYFDFYLLHSVEKQWYPVYEKYDCFGWALKKKEEGLIRHFGFSYHDDPELLDMILTAHPEVEFVQIQMNYLDWENPVVQAHANYDVCRKHGVYVNVMEPVKGGTLAALPEKETEILRKVNPDGSTASWAIRFVLSHEGMLTVLSGMSSMDQMNDNMRTVSDFHPLNDQENKAVHEVVSSMLDKPAIGCTACRYCVDGCPMRITIPELFRAMNSYTMYGDNNRARGYYKAAVSGDHARASDCIQCGRCETSCPQHLPIRTLLEKVKDVFD